VSDTLASLRRKIDSAQELQAVVRAMKAMAGANLAQYERSVEALASYHRTVELGLAACLRGAQPGPIQAGPSDSKQPANAQVVVFGSDQGLVGSFNDSAAAFALQSLQNRPGNVAAWAVGVRVQERLIDAGWNVVGTLAVPNSVEGITDLVGRILMETEVHARHFPASELYLVHQRPLPGSQYEPKSQRLLPLDDRWAQEFAQLPWPTPLPPEVLGQRSDVLPALIREHLFVSLYRACAESLASENASRLAVMERADRNIDDLLEDWNNRFHQTRQGAIDEELFDVLSGFEALKHPR